MKKLLKLSLIAILTGSFTFFGCNETDSSMSKDEASQLGGKSDSEVDLCETYGWYGDSVCDLFCQLPDPDCENSCEESGGQCVALTNEGCPDGMESADTNKYSCGGGLGVMCCIPEEAEICGGFMYGPCSEGKWCDLPETGADRAGICIDIGKCDDTTDCTKQADIGLLPNLETCPGGIPANYACVNDTCQPTCGNTENTCVEYGGQCLPLTQDGCPDGMESADANLYSCGEGILGVMCCMPKLEICGGFVYRPCTEEGKWCDLPDMGADMSGVCRDIGKCDDNNDCSKQADEGLLPNLSTCAGGIPANFACVSGQCTPTCGDPSADCIDNGGRCVPINPDGCPDGSEPLDATQNSCGANGTLGLMCCK